MYNIRERVWERKKERKWKRKVILDILLGEDHRFALFIKNRSNLCDQVWTHRLGSLVQRVLTSLCRQQFKVEKTNFLSVLLFEIIAKQSHQGTQTQSHTASSWATTNWLKFSHFLGQVSVSSMSLYQPFTRFSVIRHGNSHRPSLQHLAGTIGFLETCHSANAFTLSCIFPQIFPLSIRETYICIYFHFKRTASDSNAWHS